MRDLINLISSLQEASSAGTNSTVNQPQVANGAEPNYADKADYEKLLPALKAWLTQAGVDDVDNKIEYISAGRKLG